MAIIKEFAVPGHPSIYELVERELSISISYPDKGTTKDTGLLLMIPGFGQTMQSPFFEQVKSKYTDELNLVTVQCHYFGLEFMQTAARQTYNIDFNVLKNVLTEDEYRQLFESGASLNINQIIEVSSQYPLTIEGKEILDETNANFNDMGIMQAIDNITAVLSVISILDDNQMPFNTEKIMIYGQGHGAYLGYLCNAFAPKLFSHLFDLSSWLICPYLNSTRYMNSLVGKMGLQIMFKYMASTLKIDNDLLYLPTLYRNVYNRCNIFAFDFFSEAQSKALNKQDFLNRISNCLSHEFSKEETERFQSSPLELFHYIIHSHSVNKTGRNAIALPSHTIETKSNTYHFDYTEGMPLLNRISKQG
jgi:hypothetical protein